MLLVGAFYRRGERSLYDPETRRLIRVDDKKELSEKTFGFYSDIDGDLIVFYRDDERLRLLLNDRVYDFDELRIVVLQKETIAEGNEKRWTREVIVSRGNQCVYKRRYRNFCQEFVFDFTPMAEPEDFDFYLFLRNVSTNLPWKRRIFADVDEQRPEQ